MSTLTLVSHHLCPYVQRAAISLAEKAVPFERIDIDLAGKPDWFLRLSPLGKVPLLRIESGGDETVIFESSVILEYLEETQPNPLHPGTPVQRARHRSWIEYGSAILNQIGIFYNAPLEPDLRTEARKLSKMFERIEEELGYGPWFAEDRFSLVDAVYGPIFRYFDVFDQVDDFSVFANKPMTKSWRRALADRTSIRSAVAPDYSSRLFDFLSKRRSALSVRIDHSAELAV